VVVERPCPPHAALHGRLAEDVADRLPERLGAVDHEQDPVPLEYSIEWLTCAVASRFDAVMVD